MQGWLSRRYPITKLMLVVFAVILSGVYDWKFAYLFVLPVCIVLAATEGKFFSYVKKEFLTLFIMLIVMFLFKFILDETTEDVYLSLGFMQISKAGIYAGLKQTKLIVAMVATFLLYFDITDLEDLMIALQQKNVSHVATFVILSTMQMIPDMIARSKVIMQSQEARGIETKGNVIARAKAFFPSLGPLVISSLNEIEERSITLEVRGFSSENEKTTLKDIKKDSFDSIAEIISVTAFAGLLGWKVYTWLF